MTEKLKTLLDRAADADFTTPDLDAITRAGVRSVRRRRAGLAAAAVALVVGVGGVALVVGDGGPRRDDAAVAGDRTPVTAITWAADGAIHTAEGGTYEVGRPIAAYVRTSVGYVFTDGEGGVFSFVDGTVTEVGSTDRDRAVLFADPESSLAGWVDPSGEAPVFAVHDQADGTTTTFGEFVEGMGRVDDQRNEFEIYAVDGRTAYVHDARGAIAVDVDSGQFTVLEPRPEEWYEIKGVEDGLIAFASPYREEEPDAGATVVGRSPTDGVDLAPGWGDSVSFSPDARWASIEGDEPAVYDTATGEQVGIDIGGRPFGTGFDWIDDDTIVVGAAARMVGPLQILTCELPSGECTVVVEDLGLFDEIEGRIAFADGRADD